MTDKELKKLGTKALIDSIRTLEQENDELRAQLRILAGKLESRRIELDTAGSIAEASVKVSGVFEAAQQAAAQYLENIERLSAETEAACSARDEKSRRNSEYRLLETERQCRQMEYDAQARAEAILAEAQRQVDAKWQDITDKLNAFYQSHQEIRELVDKNRDIFCKE